MFSKGVSRVASSQVNSLPVPAAKMGLRQFPVETLSQNNRSESRVDRFRFHRQNAKYTFMDSAKWFLSGKPLQSFHA